MQRSMPVFAVSAMVVMATGTSQGMHQGRLTGGPPSSAARASAPHASARTIPVVPSSPEETNGEPVQERLRRDPIRAAMFSGRMPAGTNLMVVAAGFQDVGQFAAAVSASKNLGIPFHQLKRRMVQDGMPLRLAIQDIRPHSNYRAATRVAEEEAAAILGTAVEANVPASVLSSSAR